MARVLSPDPGAGGSTARRGARLRAPLRRPAGWGGGRLLAWFLRADHLPALRVGIGLAVPGAALIVAGSADLLVYAVFGSFVGMYGRGQRPAARLQQQGWAAAQLGLAVAAGLALSAGGVPPWGIALTSVAFAAFASWAAGRVGSSPSGPFFGIFALGTFATLPPGEADLRYALVIYGATVALCLIVGQIGPLNRLGAAPGQPAPGGVGGAGRAGARRRALACALAVAAASAAALLLGIGHAGWAAAGATIPLAASTLRGQTLRGVECVLGTVLGIGLAGAVLVPGLPATAQAVLVMWLLFPTEALMARNYGLALGFFTPLILLMTDLAGPAEPFVLLLDRLSGAVLGAAVGVAVAWLFARTSSPTAAGTARPRARAAG